jgi:transcriptional regulator with XRE-family HTH domain
MAKGLTQGEIAGAIGTDQGMVSRLESGKRRMTVLQFVTLADAIGFDAVSALEGGDTPGSKIAAVDLRMPNGI